MPIVNCTGCGTPTPKTNWHIANTKTGGLFCSRACRGAFLSSHQTFTCVRCGLPFSRSGVRIRRGRTKFCSHSCYSAHDAVGHYVDARGYRVLIERGQRVLEHRRVVENLLGRKLRPDEHVHHVDGDKLNNSPQNLRVLSGSQHSSEHHPLLWDIEVGKALIRAGFTLRETAYLCGVSRAAIRQALERRGLSVRIIRGANNPTALHGHNKTAFLPGTRLSR